MSGQEPFGDYPERVRDVARSLASIKGEGAARLALHQALLMYAVACLRTATIRGQDPAAIVDAYDHLGCSLAQFFADHCAAVDRADRVALVLAINNSTQDPK